jgi:hypothetical protein
MKRMQCRLSHRARGVASCGAPMGGILVWLDGLLLVCRTYRSRMAWKGVMNTTTQSEF